MLCFIFVVVLKSELCDLGLAVSTCLPTYLRTLISSDVNVFSREELANLCEDVLKELHCLLSTYAKHVVCNTPHAPHLIRTASTAILRICCKSCEHMSWKVDLRDDGNALCSSVFQDLLYFLLSVIAASAILCIVECLALKEVSYDSLVSD